jgi:hypothetical protein
MKFAVEMAPGVLIYIKSFIKIGAGVHTFLGGDTHTDTHTHTQTAR